MASLFASQFVPAFAVLPQTVTAQKDLAAISVILQGSKEQGAHEIKFSTYDKVGQLKLDVPNPAIETLTLTRDNFDSDSAIKVDSTLLDLKNITATVVLKGLAFKLGPKGVLLTGVGNRHLLIESCFIYADSVESTFLSWLSDANGNVEIRNSYFVFKGAKAATTRIKVTGGDILLTNNLINFPGAISAEVYKRLVLNSNTFNRTQFDLVGKLYQGQPTYTINQNLFAHHGKEDIFSLGSFWVASFSGFNDLGGSSVTANRMYSSWKGFDYSENKRFIIDTSYRTNVRCDSTFDGKPASELWNWYTDVKDPKTGVLSGDIPRIRYNVLPDTVSKIVVLDKDALTVNFQPAVFPRMITAIPDTRPATVDSTLRLRFPSLGPLYFGPFRIQSISLPGKPVHGKPVLLAKNDSGKFEIQRSGSAMSDAASNFVNGLPGSRSFILADSTNTPAGANISPGAGSFLSIRDRLRFKKVDIAGHTTVFEEPKSDFPPNYRYLSKRFSVTTTAEMNTEATLGGVDGVAPYWDSVVYWMVPPNTFVHADKPATGPDAGIYVGTTSFNTALGNLKAYLVEKLTVPMGGATFDMAEGSVRAAASKGYQLRIDSSGTYQSANYGLGSKGYSFSWAGREDTDTLTLILKGKAGQNAYVKVDAAEPESLDVAMEADGKFKIRIVKTDAGKTFFLATKFNVIAGEIVSRPVPDGVTLIGYKSSTSGKLSFSDLPDDFLDSQAFSKDTNFRYTLFLGGKSFIASFLTPETPFGMSFNIGTVRDSTKVQAWYHDGKIWNKIKATPFSKTSWFVDGLPPATQKLIFVEKWQSPKNFVRDTVSVVNNKISVTPTYKDSALKQITGYCLQVKSIDQAGTVEPEGCLETFAIGKTTEIKLDSGKAYLYRVQYFIDKEPLNGSFEILKGHTWNANAILKSSGLAVKEKYRWHLIGYPFSGAFTDVMKRDPAPLDTGIKDETVLIKVTMKKGIAKYDTADDLSKVTFRAGDAYLFASVRQVTLQADSSRVLPPETVSLPMNAGWNFIANPFPTNFKMARVRTSTGSKPRFYELSYDPTKPPASAYSWKDTAEALRAFVGYAVHVPAADSLIFDPLSGQADSAAAKSTASPKALDRLQVRLNSSLGDGRMILTTDPKESDIPFLPAPGASVQFRVGGHSGYMSKTVRGLENIDEPVEIQSPGPGTAAFSVSTEPGYSAARPGKPIHMRLLDPVSGKIYDETSASAVPIAKGSQSFRLLAGDATFLEERTRAFQAGAPREIGLSQNFPNPFRGKTRVALDWPAWETGERRAMLEVLDMQGRSVARIRIADIRVGRQVVDLDASAWKPGIYLYRLTVVTGGSRAALQKRMLVSP